MRLVFGVGRFMVAIRNLVSRNWIDYCIWFGSFGAVGYRFKFAIHYCNIGFKPVDISSWAKILGCIGIAYITFHRWVFDAIIWVAKFPK